MINLWQNSSKEQHEIIKKMTLSFELSGCNITFELISKVSNTLVDTLSQ